jgi:aspartate/methionine/tyrosine aminotransferase
MAFVTLGSKGLEQEHCDALIKKYMGVIRSSVSCSNTPAQNLMLKTMADRRSTAEKEEFFRLLKGRYQAVKQFIDSRPSHPVLSPLPFNSGYFMSFRCNGADAETLRRALLERGIGVIALGRDYLRVTFAAIDEKDIPAVYEKIYETASEAARA